MYHRLFICHLLLDIWINSVFFFNMNNAAISILLYVFLYMCKLLLSIIYLSMKTILG